MSRVLGVKRYSGDDDAGALQRQEEALDAWIRANGVKLAAWVEDETVSGGVNLDERPALGKWLKPPLLDEWDILAVTEQDRITRDDLHWWGFVANLTKWGKAVRVLDDPGMDLTTPNGRMLAGIKATQVANYRLDVKKKIRNARESFRQHRRWAGGHWPYGYRATPNPDGDGWILVEDKETSALVKEAVERIVAAETLRAIAGDWNRRGIPTGRDHQQATKLLKPGESRPEPKGYRWNESTLTKILSSPSLIGRQRHNGEIITEDGIPVEFMPPIVDKEDFDRVQEILGLRGDFRRGIKGTASDLLGVLFCPCGDPLYRVNSTTDGRSDRQPGRKPGDPDTGLAGGCRDHTGHGAPRGQTELESEPTLPAHWEYSGTGESYGHWWDSHPDWFERGRRLRNDGVRVVLGGTKAAPVVLYLLPADLQKRVNDSATGEADLSFLLGRDEHLKAVVEERIFLRQESAPSSGRWAT
ncbi:recombinase family protein [Catenulispora rubra]|uniref:recombinase family protein n=1 Tax=Catenulispora rubra TaxID=280293 RepID=UPI001891F57B|nr:recombinase family protein [Catenulispora rubra]